MLMIIGRSFITLVILAAAPFATAQTSPDPSQFYIQQISYVGSGCTAGTAAVNIAPDGKAFTVLFDSFVVDGTNVPNQQAETWRGCQLNLTTHVPDGWTYRLKSVDVRGYANLTPGSRGLISSWYQFTRVVDPWSIMIDRQIAGPYDGDYQASSVQHPSAPWFPCEDQIRTNNPLKIWNRVFTYGRGLIATDSIDGTLSYNYDIEWKRCGPPRRDGWGLCGDSAGYMRDGQCWFEGAPGASCSQVCQARGGVTAAALANSGAVCSQFSTTVIDGWFSGSGACPAALGCGLQGVAALQCTNGVATASASAPGWGRFCPCAGGETRRLFR